MAFRDVRSWAAAALLSQAATAGTLPLPSPEPFSGKPWGQAIAYVLDHMPSCREYGQQTATATLHDDTLVLQYPKFNYGTTESLPLDKPFVAEARSLDDGHWRLFVRFRRDVVHVEMPYIRGSATFSEFSCDAERQIAVSLASALTRIGQLEKTRREIPTADGGG